MKKRKKLIKRIGALLCALVVAVSSLGFSGTFYGAVSSSEIYSYFVGKNDKYTAYSIPFDYVIDEEVLVNYPYFVVLCSVDSAKVDVYYSEMPFYFYANASSTKGQLRINTTGKSLYYCSTDGDFCFSNEIFAGATGHNLISSIVSETSYTMYKKVFASNHDIFWVDSSEIWFAKTVNFDGSSIEKYNSAIGYLQNVRMDTVFDDVPLGENVGETYTTRWYYDQFSTTGIDLTSGDYFIRYYQERWIVKGYGDDDVIEKSNRYILGDFIVQNGYIETYSVDVESTLHGQGYEEPSFTDLLWNKFVTTHYYFQIVDAKNNGVGGLLHIYLTDDNGKFGVEHIGETLDNEGNYDDSGYKDFIDDDSITSDDVESGFNELEQDNEQTLEEWFEDFSDTPIGDVNKLEGSEAFSTIFRSYVLQVASVSSAVGAIFALLPAWVLGLLGISFVLLFILILLNES